MTSKRVRPWLAICAALLVGTAVYFVYGWAPSSGGHNHPRVLAIGNQFSSEIAILAEPFNKLVEDANRRIELRSSIARKYKTITTFVGWMAVAVTIVITILAGILGIDVNKVLTSNEPQKRSKIVVLLAFLAAVSSSLQVVDAKLQRETTQNREAAEALFQETTGARARFANSGSSSQMAQEATDLLRKAVFADSIER